MKYSLRSLMIVLVVLPLIIGVGFTTTVRFMAETERMPEGGSNFDDVQYFAPGPEFKLSREAAAMRSRKEDEQRLGQAFCPLQP
mgnify:FL=1